MSRRPLSEHLRLELACGWRLEPGHPVPGCGCLTCLVLRAGGTYEDAHHLRDVVRHLALLPPSARADAVRTANEERSALGLDPLPLSPAVLAERARMMPGAVREVPPPGGRDPLPVERARRVPIREVCARLGLGEPAGRWGEPRVLCPLHNDTKPSLRLREPDGLVYCDPCARGGDGIWLVMEALGVGFADAVRWLADGRTAADRDPAQHSLASGATDAELPLLAAHPEAVGEPGP